MTENTSTLLERLSKRSFPIDELYAARKNTHLAPLAELILASQQVAAQASEQWEFKSLAQFGREDFILSASINDYNRWAGEAQRELAFCVTRLILSEVDEGLLFFVEGEDGRHRVARSGDKPYDFVRRLEAEQAVFDLRFTTAPTWASELFLGHENFEAFKLVWYDYSDSLSNPKYKASRNLRADAVIRETVRRMGSIPGFPSDAKVIDVPPDKHLNSAERDHVSPKLATSASPGKPLTTTERKTLLTIIAALCDYSAIKHQDRGAAAKIATMTDEIGASVTDDTIRGVLAKIPDALAIRMK